MVKHCDFCGANLDEDEVENSELIGKQVCRDCLHGGIELLRKVLNSQD